MLQVNHLVDFPVFLYYSYVNFNELHEIAMKIWSSLNG